MVSGLGGIVEERVAPIFVRFGAKGGEASFELPPSKPESHRFFRYDGPFDSRKSIVTANATREILRRSEGHTVLLIARRPFVTG